MSGGYLPRRTDMITNPADVVLVPGQYVELTVAFQENDEYQFQGDIRWVSHDTSIIDLREIADDRVTAKGYAVGEGIVLVEAARDLKWDDNTRPPPTPVTAKLIVAVIRPVDKLASLTAGEPQTPA